MSRFIPHTGIWYSDAAEQILQHLDRAKIIAPAKDGWTALMIAAKHGRLETVEFLLENYSDNITYVNRSNDMALVIVIKHKQCEIAGRLLKKMKKLDDAQVDKVWLLAAETGLHKIVSSLFKKISYVDICSPSTSKTEYCLHRKTDTMKLSSISFHLHLKNRKRWLTFAV